MKSHTFQSDLNEETADSMGVSFGSGGESSTSREANL